MQTNGEAPVRFVPLGLGKSLVVDLPRDAKDVLVANPAIANAVVRSARRAYIIGVAVGQTNVFFFDAEGRQIAGYDIAVTRDLNGIRAAIKQAVPNADIRVEGLGPEGVVLTGTVSSAAEAQQAFDIATRLLSVGSKPATDEGHKVVNAITIRGRDQVMLKVTVAEVQRDVIKQLGVNLSGSFGYGANVVNFNTDNPFTVAGKAISNTAASDIWAKGSSNVKATLQAMERAGVIRTLAEPNLTAVSGESASFLVGGEFPVPGGYTCDTTTTPPTCQIQIQFKKFGVGLTFTPVVLSEGRISLKVMTEVSELSSDNAITLQPSGQVQPITIPVDPRPPRRHHGRDSLRRRARHGRHDPGADEAADQRRARPDAASHPGRPVQEPRLPEPPDRADGPRDALHRCARSRPRICRGRTTDLPTPPIRRPCSSAASTASTASPDAAIRASPIMAGPVL